MIQVDGSMMEGGGQLLRMATTYSAILKKPIHVTKIRAKRRQSGLKPQHFMTLKAAAKLCNAKTKGVKIGSNEIKFSPKQIQGGSYKFNIGTAGSISLLLQCLVPIAAHADKETILRIIGGTAVKWSPTITFLEKVVYKAFRDMGIDTLIQVERQGFYPKGGGNVKINIKPAIEIKPINAIIPLQVSMIKGISLCSRLPSHVAHRQAEAARKIIETSKIRNSIESYTIHGENTPFSAGSYICLWAEDPKIYIGADSLGERGKPAEKVGEEAAQSILNQIQTKTSVDKHTSDHLILLASLAKGRTEFTTSEITLHSLTSIELSKKFTESDFTVIGKKGDPGHIICSGQ